MISYHIISYHVIPSTLIGETISPTEDNPHCLGTNVTKTSIPTLSWLMEKDLMFSHGGCVCAVCKGGTQQ